ncbi:MAG: M48 family metallopeptidase [Cyclobacteriaceae bacterium]|nr:M48 family metallopeptidase [Cyclobacteriaceae bacterium SS2]
MIQKIYKELLIVVGVFLLVWMGIILLKPVPEAPEVAVSIETEMELGDKLAEEVLDNYTVINSDTVSDAIYKIKDKLLSSIGLTSYDYSFYVVKEEQVNAFATLGGHIFIFSGMIEMAEEPEELAAVLAHEIGHVEERHVVNKLVKEIGVTVLFSILSGGDPVLISEIARAAVSSAFDRSQESEADLFAMKALEKAQISPRYVASIFRRIKEKYGGYDERLEFLMSHPNLNKRIKESLEYPLADDFEPATLEIDWAAVKRNL